MRLLTITKTLKTTMGEISLVEEANTEKVKNLPQLLQKKRYNIAIP